jgi:hypothetical protein
MTPFYVIAIGALCTLGIYSILYRENPVFRFFEHVFIGVAAGYGFYFIITNVLHPLWWTPLVREGKWYWAFPFLIGAMFYLIYSRRLVWMARLVMVSFMGLFAGSQFKGFITGYVPWIRSSFQPVLGPKPPYVQFTNLAMFITLITVMSYFFFSISHKNRTVTGSARVGRWLLMLAFGAIFGSTVMGRMALFIDRVAFLLFDFLRLPR